MPILLILCVKKNVQLFLGLFWGLEGLGYFLFPVSVFVHRLSIAPRQGQRVWGLGGQFLECKFRTFKKVRTASDKFITRLNLIMSRSSSVFSEPFS